MVKDLMMDGDKKGEMLAERAEGLLMSLKQRFPALTQTTLDTTKIQCNKVSCAYTIHCLFHYQTPQHCNIIVVGCWKVHLGELLTGSGEPGIQHSGTDRRLAVCG